MQIRKSVWLALSATLAVALLASACGAPATATTAPTQAPAATKAPAPTAAPPTPTPEPKVVTVSFVQEPDTLNPWYTQMWFSSITRDFWLRGLWVFDDDNNPVPQLAAEVPSEANGGISDGGKTITLKLNPKAVWSDGTPVTSADFKFTYDMIMSDKNTVQSRYPYADYVDSVETPDAQTVVVNFNEPFAPWLTTIFTAVMPKHVLEPVFSKEGSLDNAEWNRAPTVGVGPYVFSEWESGSHLLFTRNDAWFGPAPKVDQVFIRIVPDDAAQLAAIKAGDTDIGVFLNYGDVPDIESAGTAAVVAVLSGYDEGWFLNMDASTAHPAMLDVRVRRALALATDRAKITQDLLLGLTEPPATFWDGTPPYGDPSLKPYAYDPEQAKKLLDEAGWKDTNGDGTRDKDGVELKLRYITNQRQLRKDVQAVVQQMWAQVGVGAELVNYSSDVYWNSYGDGGPQAIGQYDVAEYSSVGEFPDPEASNNWLCSEIPSPDKPEGTNWQGYCNDQLDALFKQQASTVDPQARIKLFYQIEKIMYDDVVWIGLWKDPDLWSINKRLTGVRLAGATPFWNVTDWDVTK